MEDVRQRGAWRAPVFGYAPVGVGRPEAEAVREVEPVGGVRVGESFVVEAFVAAAWQAREAPVAQAAGSFGGPGFRGGVVRLDEALVGVVAALLAVGAARVAPVGAGEDDAAPDGIDGPFDAPDAFHMEKPGRHAMHPCVQSDGTVFREHPPGVRNFITYGKADDFGAAAQVARGGDRGTSGEGRGAPGVFQAETPHEGAGLRVANRAFDRLRRKRERHFVGAPPLPVAPALVRNAPETVDFVCPRAAALALHFAEGAAAARFRLFDE